MGPTWGNDVVHNDKFGGVVKSSWAEFSKGSPVYIHRKAAGNYFDRQAITQRALSLLGMKYALLDFNCEHAATFAQTGKAESPQVAIGIGVALLAVIGLGLAAVSDA